MASLLQRRPGGDVEVEMWMRAAGGDVRVTPGVVGMDTPEVVEGPSPVEEVFAQRPFYVAHRLGGTEFPEHTTAGMRASIDAGFRAFEFSTYPTSDGVFIGSHDWTTERTTGVLREIWQTPWSEIQTLSQAAGPIIRLEDAVAMLPDDGVLVLDHKVTSSSAAPNAGDIASEARLFDKLDELFDDPTKRVVWKLFAEASSAERARNRGYQVMCMLYPSTMVGADYSRWDILGMEYNAPQGLWDELKATGKPTIAHIITTDAQARTGLARGADGLMSSVPTIVHPT